MSNDKPTINDIIVLASLPNGNVHQVLVSKSTAPALLQLINVAEGGIKLCEIQLQGLKITNE